MASKKQRRRRQKERRHEWEYVYVDDEGEEVEVEEQPAPVATKAGGAPTKRPSGRAGRVAEPPSWRRVFKRAAIFAPLMLIVVVLLQGKKHSYGQAIYQTALLMAVFIPFSYVMDTMMYRAFRKRTGGGAQPKGR
jgi:ferric-dicitrate binding protein FerR (iron transport regulator)